MRRGYTIGIIATTSAGRIKWSASPPRFHWEDLNWVKYRELGALWAMLRCFCHDIQVYNYLAKQIRQSQYLHDAFAA